MKKLIAIATTLTVAAMIVGPGTANALTAAELQVQINALLAQLQTLQSQLAGLGGTTTGTGVAVSCTFSRNLYPGMSGADVKCLQQYLNAAGHTVSATGAGSPGNETEYYGSRTQGGVQKWQDANALAYGAWGGYFGPMSITKYNALAAGGTTPTTPTTPTDPGTVPAGGLSIGLSYDTSASATVADNANANFTKFSMTAGSGPVKVSKIYVTRSGLSANADVENIKIIDAATGEYKGSIGSLNVDNRAMITFIPKLEIPAGTTKSYYIRAGIANGTTAGKTAILSIASNDDIVSDATSVSGAPVTGNAMSVVSLTIGSVTVDEDGTTIDSQPDVGDTDVTVLKFKITAGSTEPITVETITVMKSGTTDVSDTANLDLYDVTNGKSLGTVDTWSADERATWNNLNLVIAKGKTVRFKIMLDVLDDPGKTVNVDMTDGSDVLVTAKGGTYGFYITPGQGATWTAAAAASKGKGSNDQTIKSGALVVTKSASSPATGNIAAGDDIVLGIFDFEAKGEEIKVTALDLNFTYAVGLGDTDVTNVVLVDKDGTTVCGPADVGSTTAGEAVYSDTFIVPVGIHEYTVKVSLADSASNGDQLQVGVKGPTASVVAQGMTSNETIAPTPAGNQNANNMTVAAATLEVRTLGAPAARSLPSGLSDFVFATFSFDAGASGEDVQITAITVTDSVSGAAAGTDVDNAELWADLTDGTSSRGDVYETKISDTEQWTGAAGNASSTAYTLNQTLTIPKTTSVRMAFVSDIVSGATGSHVFFVDASGDVTSNGAETGESATVTVNHTSKQTMTLATSGALTVTKDSSTPVAGIVIGGKTSTLAVFRLAANNVESFDLDQITLTASNGSFVDTFYFYDGDELLGSIAGADSPTKYFNDGTLTIPANGNKKITIKAKLYDVDNSVINNDSPIAVGADIAAAIQVTGLASGSTVTSATNPTVNAQRIFKTRPYFSLNSASPSGDLFPSTNMLLAIFDVTAEDTEDVTFTQADSNAIRFTVNLDAADTGSDRMMFVLKDEDGNTLEDNIELADSFNHGATTVISASVDVNFTDKEFIVPAGQTKKLYLYGDTSMLEDDGDFIQVWLDDNKHEIYWGVNGVTDENWYTRGDIIFRGDIYGGSFVNPS